MTGSGLIFIGATADEKFRAFDLETGEELWKVSTPTASYGNTHDLRSGWPPIRRHCLRRSYVVVPTKDF